MNILILGSGGRECAFAWKLYQSTECNRLYIAPGNAGTSEYGTNVNIGVNEFDKLAEYIRIQEIGMLVVGPEDPLVNGIRDFFESRNEFNDLIIIGPEKSGARLEGSKDFSKHFMQRNGIPTAAYKTFTTDTLDEGYKFLETLSAPYVLKADGLAAGKGVVIPSTLDEAKSELKEMLADAKFGSASSRVVIEEFLKGIELSVFVLTDGEHYIILPEAKDYKRIGEGDTGPNTGGMGAVSPVHFADKDFMDKVENRIIKPTIEGLKKESITYKGFIFIGLMNVDGNPYVIEYNVRMGDPETEVVIPRLKNDLVGLFRAVHTGTLNEVKVDTDERTALTVILASGGYPGAIEKGKPVTGLEEVEDSIVFHAGTAMQEGLTVTTGGRVLAVTSMGSDLREAAEKSIQNAERIQFDKKYFRRDIGNDLM